MIAEISTCKKSKSKTISECRKVSFLIMQQIYSDVIYCILLHVYKKYE